MNFDTQCIIKHFLTGNLQTMPPPTSQGPPLLGNQPPSPSHYGATPPTSQVGYTTNPPPPISGYGMSHTPGAPSSYPPPPQAGQPTQTHSGRSVHLIVGGVHLIVGGYRSCKICCCYLTISCKVITSSVQQSTQIFYFSKSKKQHINLYLGRCQCIDCKFYLSKSIALKFSLSKRKSIA